ncbi:SDR family NAD(P)-dependent oxidoreductase [Myxococcota bacterium]|nr:SDR family NAD(P)-dependent oxidoreductase [Myxococcota bacterium]
MKPLEGKTAIVTGASRGIGKGCALQLGEAGATVYVTGRTRNEGDASLPGTVDATADAVTNLGGRGIGVLCDHRDDEAVASLFQRVEDEQGGLDILVNNAFLIPPELTSGKPFWEVPISNWDDMIDVGTRSAYVATRFAARIMVPRGQGLIANVSSSGAAEYAWHVAYGVGKCALDRMTADCAFELQSHGVAMVSLWPGLVRTERTEKVGDAIPELNLDTAESSQFTGRAIVHLASDPKVLQKSGKAFPSRDLADEYGFTDIDGSLPAGPLHERPKGTADSQP